MSHRLVRLTFPEALIREPVVYRLGKDFPVVTSIFRASVGSREAWVILELTGEEEEIRRALAFLQGLGIGVEEISESEIE